MLHTTFTLLHEHHACERGFKKLARALGGITKYGKNTPIPLARIVETNDLSDALWCLRATMPEEAQDMDRIARLLACDCAGHVLHFFEEKYPEDKRPRQAIEAARQYMAGAISIEELTAARAAMWATGATEAMCATEAMWATWATGATGATGSTWAMRAMEATEAMWATGATGSMWAIRAVEELWQTERLLAYLNGTEGGTA